MFDEKSVVLLYTLTPLHAGSGSSLSIVDLPIQREVHTDLPIIQASELKGVLRDYYKNKLNDKELDAIFGHEDPGGDYSSCISIQDARILFFPVKSVKGVFAYTTSPSVLNGFLREIGEKEINFNVAEDKAIAFSEKVKLDGDVILEEFTFNVEENNVNEKLKKLLTSIAQKLSNDETSYIKDGIPEKVVILHDDIFREFTKHFTEVVARTRIDDNTGTVKGGALWYEENVPRDTLLYTVFRYNRDFAGMNMEANAVKSRIEDNVPEIMQIGGNKTIGRGFTLLKTFDMHTQEVKDE